MKYAMLIMLTILCVGVLVLAPACGDDDDGGGSDSDTDADCDGEQGEGTCCEADEELCGTGATYYGEDCCTTDETCEQCWSENDETYVGVCVASGGECPEDPPEE